MSEGRVALAIEGPIARVSFDRPQAHNAVTFAMYDQLSAICERLQNDDSVKVAVFRGEGGKSFVSGTDIGELGKIADGAGGLAYETRIDAWIGRLETLPQPTIALIDGWAVGGGLALAAACDFRLATVDAKFGAPIALTIGNCYSPANTKRLIVAFGAPRAKRILMLGEMIGAEEAKSCGFVLDIVEASALQERTTQLVTRLLENAPLTVRASKEMIRRISHGEVQDDGADLIAAVYESQDFRTGVRTFKAKTKPTWRGR